MQKAIALLAILTLPSLSLFAQNPNLTSSYFPANLKENVDAKSVTFAANSGAFIKKNYEIDESYEEINENYEKVTEKNELILSQKLLAQNYVPTNGTQNATNAEKSLKMIPKVDLPKEPNASFWQKLQNEPDELTEAEKQDLLDLLYDFYRVSQILNQQLEDVGKPTRFRLEAPPISGINQIDDAEELDLPIALQRQIAQAKRLKKEIESIEQPTSNLKIEALQNSIIEIRRQYDSNDYALKNQINELKKELEESKLGEIKNENYKSLYSNSRETMNQIIYQLNNYAIPILAVSAGATTNIFTGLSDFSSQFSPSFGINFNPTVFLGLPDILDIWADYSNPTVKVSQSSSDNINANSSENKHFLSNLEAGMNLHVSLSKPLGIEKFNWLLKAGFGYFWLVDEIPNTNFVTNVWQGYMYKLETEVFNLASRFPVGVYASYSFKRIYNNIASIETNNTDLSEKWFGSINVGLKFFLAANSSLKKTEQ